MDGRVLLLRIECYSIQSNDANIAAHCVRVILVGSSAVFILVRVRVRSKFRASIVLHEAQSKVETRIEQVLERRSEETPPIPRGRPFLS